MQNVGDTPTIGGWSAEGLAHERKEPASISEEKGIVATDILVVDE